MIRIPARVLAVLGALPGVLLSACAGVTSHHPDEHKHDATMHHRFDDVERWVKVFDDPARDAWQRPADVMNWLAISGGATVADLGAGTGYFTVHQARAVGATGRVYALDIEPTLVAHLERRAREAGLSQVIPLLAAADDPKLPAAAVDLVLVCDTWHHIDDRLAYLPRLARALSANGRLAILDFKEGDLPIGPPAGHKLTPEAVKHELELAGWKIVQENYDLPYQYLLIFEPLARGARPINR